MGLSRRVFSFLVSSMSLLPEAMIICGVAILSAEEIPRIPIGLDRVPGYRNQEEQRMAKELGLNFIHETSQWIEPEPNQYAWPQSVREDKFLAHLKQLKKWRYKVSVTFTNVHMDQKHLPAYLKDKRFNDPYLLERWEKYLETFLPRYGDYIDFLNIGNEVNNYFGRHHDEWQDYVQFFKRGAEVIRRSRPNVRVGVVLVEDSREKFWKAVAPYCDHLAITFYTPCSVFAKSPTAEALDKTSPKYFRRTLDEAIRIVGEKKLLITEVGCATHPALDSSPELQAQFIESLFGWLRGKEDKILAVSWLSAKDWPYEGTKRALKGYLDPALLKHERFMKFLTSLGLRYEDGARKPGYYAFQQEIARYRKGKPEKTAASDEKQKR